MMFLLQYKILLFLLLINVCNSTTISITGQLICCKNKPITSKLRLGLPSNTIPPDCHTLNGNVIELWEHDFINPDDYIDATRTKDNGEFFIEGAENEVLDVVDFYMKSYHTCGLTDFEIKNQV